MHLVLGIVVLVLQNIALDVDDGTQAFEQTDAQEMRDVLLHHGNKNEESISQFALRRD